MLNKRKCPHCNEFFNKYGMGRHMKSCRQNIPDTIDGVQRYVVSQDMGDNFDLEEALIKIINKLVDKI